MAASSQREDRGDREGGIRVKYDGSALVPVTGPVRACMRRVGCNGWCRALSTNDVDRYNPRDEQPRACVTHNPTILGPGV